MMYKMENSAVKTIDRFVEILDCFAHEQRSLSLVELSTYLDLPKSTLHRFLVSLESHGILRRQEDNKRWQLGYHLIAWGNLASKSTSLREIARPFMRELVTATGETAILSIYHDHEVIIIDMCETSHSVRLKMEIGMRSAPHAGASSKVLLAYLPEEEIMAIVKEKGLPKLCTNTITELHRLLEELEKIRLCGFAFSLEETDQGAWGVATPIFDMSNRMVGAIGIAGPTQRYSKDKLDQFLELCRRQADRISEVLNVGIHSTGNKITV
jgi:DNA-binding IclR family transcriptional regulator